MPWKYHSDDGVDKTIEVIVDPEYRGDLKALAETRLVWIVDTPHNRPAIDACWAIGKQANLCEVNRYTEPDADREENLINIIISMDTHYRYFGFVVHGAIPSPSLVRRMAEWGFEIAEKTPDGFFARAMKTPERP
jgi:hypothetical protein